MPPNKLTEEEQLKDILIEAFSTSPSRCWHNEGGTKEEIETARNENLAHIDNLVQELKSFLSLKKAEWQKEAYEKGMNDVFINASDSEIIAKASKETAERIIGEIELDFKDLSNLSKDDQMFWAGYNQAVAELKQDIKRIQSELTGGSKE